MTPRLLTLFCEALSDLTPQEVELGFREASKRLKFFPTTAEIRGLMEAALERTPEAYILQPPTALNVTDMVGKRLRKKGVQWRFCARVLNRAVAS